MITPIFLLTQCSDVLPKFPCSAHRIWWQKDHHAVLNIALVNAGSDSNVAKREFREDEGVFHDNIFGCIKDGLDEPGVFAIQDCEPLRPL